MISENIQQLIKQDYQNGLTKTQIAKKYNISPTTVRKYTKDLTVIYDELTNQRFGKLLVLHRVEKNKNRVARTLQYLCKCDCGNEVIVAGSSLRSGHTTTCGCSRKRLNSNNLVGQRFGKLVVIEDTGKSTFDRHAIWKCKCDCGQTIEVSTGLLTSGSTKSCGCLHSWKEQEIKGILQRYNINFISEYSFSDLRSEHGKPLRFDFAIFDNSNNICLLIEYQGSQHFDDNNQWHTDDLVKSDLAKKQYCKLHNYNLIELKQGDDIEWIIKKLLKI